MVMIAITAIGWRSAPTSSTSSAAPGTDVTSTIGSPRSASSRIGEIGEAIRPSDRGRRQPFVLVVDDDLDTRELYRACFDTNGYRTAEAVTGSQAIASAVELVPDVLLTDFVLPDVDGLAIALRLKSDPRTASICIIMVTGYATPDLESRAQAAGIERVLLKPCLPQVVLREVARALGRPAYRKPAAPSRRADVLPAKRVFRRSAHFRPGRPARPRRFRRARRA